MSTIDQHPITTSSISEEFDRKRAVQELIEQSFYKEVTLGTFFKLLRDVGATPTSESLVKLNDIKSSHQKSEKFLFNFSSTIQTKPVQSSFYDMVEDDYKEVAVGYSIIDNRYNTILYARILVPRY